ncbi:MAG: UDP-N-acetylmuramate--L-alanine ligase [Bacteroidetes bacterium]|uniref:UDP-N-acetylmuramate--L-alanine ligase n=1 Tax=Candidatus Caccoplasma merdipullorum TaxID=2840718 RepID=A0A9D9E1B9_9BACT|nr:UDP-N-acetylmuramate--L-alanine ligase [Candidatus Caccoplasma merdipullorum]
MERFDSIYFLGIGGIGMSALARYFLFKGYRVAGYDRTASHITDALSAEGAEICFDESPALIPDYCKSPENTLVVYTPAVPESHAGFSFFRENGFEIVKRAKLLGMITRNSRALCVAGTHGKTTTSSMLAHILDSAPDGCNAFLGGILKNCNSNLMLSDRCDLTVIEADEYDRSFLQLSPYMAVITAADPDHLDIYGTEEEYLKGFADFTSLIRPGGVLLMRSGVKVKPRCAEGVRVFSFGDAGSDFYAENIRVGNGRILFDFVAPDRVISDVELGVPVRINVYNAVAAMAVALLNGVDDAVIRDGVASFRGVERRFDFWIKSDRVVLLDDYAHHPDEVRASLQSVRELYPDKHITVIFYPHLYSRTRDFAPQFAEALSLADRVILLPIYPAREAPIEGVSSKIIQDALTCPESEICPKERLLERIHDGSFEVLMTMGAGDVDRFLPSIKKILLDK